jgi:lipopolysaccharide biosynthesis glycosyltransferase
MHVVFCGDKNIAIPVAVACLSIAKAVGKRSNELLISVVGVDWTDYDFEFLKNSVPDIKIEYINANHIDLPKVRKGRHVTSAAYLTLVLPDLFPNKKRILYLDYDVLVRDERFMSLWKFDLNGFPLAAVQAVNIPYISSKQGIDNWRNLKLNPQARMFNSGVMLMDLTRFRSDRIGQRAMNYAKKESHKTALADQQALNYAINGNWKPISPVYNAGLKVLYDDNSGIYSLTDAKLIDEARDNPCIIHFLGKQKPWLSTAKGKFHEEWRSLSSSCMHPTNCILPG